MSSHTGEGCYFMKAHVRSLEHLEENWEARRIALSPEDIQTIGKRD